MAAELLPPRRAALAARALAAVQAAHPGLPGDGATSPRTWPCRPATRSQAGALLTASGRSALRPGRARHRGGRWAGPLTCSTTRISAPGRNAARRGPGAGRSGRRGDADRRPAHRPASRRAGAAATRRAAIHLKLAHAAVDGTRWAAAGGSRHRRRPARGPSRCRPQRRDSRAGRRDRVGRRGPRSGPRARREPPRLASGESRDPLPRRWNCSAGSCGATTWTAPGRPSSRPSAPPRKPGWPCAGCGPCTSSARSTCSTTPNRQADPGPAHRRGTGCGQHRRGHRPAAHRRGDLPVRARRGRAARPVGTGRQHPARAGQTRAIISCSSARSRAAPRPADMDRFLALGSAAEPGDPEIEGSALAGAHGMLALLTRRAGALDGLGRGIALLDTLPQQGPRPTGRCGRYCSPRTATRGRPPERPGPAIGLTVNRVNRGLLGYADAILAGQRRHERATELAAAADSALRPYPVWADLARLFAAETALADGWGQPWRWLETAARSFAAYGIAPLASAAAGSSGSRSRAAGPGWASPTGRPTCCAWWRRAAPTRRSRPGCTCRPAPWKSTSRACSGTPPRSPGPSSWPSRGRSRD